MQSIAPARIVAVVIALTVAAGAAADVSILQGIQDPAFDSSFTLDFGAYGGPRTAQITSTNYELAADPVAEQTQFLSYNQSVDPLLLPGDISTGDITVTILESQPGSYDPLTGDFTTNDVYLIHFTEDLSMFGLQSPVELPGSASGVITFDDRAGGTIASGWTGSGQIGNPQDPSNPITFSYECVTFTQFDIVPEPATLTLLAIAALAARRR